MFSKHPLKAKNIKGKKPPTEVRSRELIIREDFSPPASNQQYKLAIKKEKYSWRYSLRRRFTNLEMFIHSVPYWKNLLTVAAFMTSVALIGSFTYVLLNTYGKLPDKFPLIYSQANNTWTLIDKELLIGLPIVVAVILIFLIKLNSATYQFDRRLAQIVNSIIIIFNLMGIIATMQLFSLVLIY